MNKKIIFISSLCLPALVLAACSSVTGAPLQASSSAPAQNNQTAAPAAQQAAPQLNNAELAAQSHEGGAVTVDVIPVAFQADQPLAFEIAMNTHSVDLSDDMTKIVILRDDGGKEYKPSAWEGGAAGGHHRSGTLKFAALSSKPKFIELVILGLAKVPERVFRWDIP